MVLLQSGEHRSRVSWMAVLSLSRARVLWERSKAGELLMNFPEYGFLVHGLNSRQVQPMAPGVLNTHSTSQQAIVEFQQLCITNGSVLRRVSCHWRSSPVRIVGTLCLVGLPDANGEHERYCAIDAASGQVLCALDGSIDNVGTIKSTVATGCVGFNDSNYMTFCFRLQGAIIKELNLFTFHLGKHAVGQSSHAVWAACCVCTAVWLLCSFR
jgi:hypothetical protein